MTMNIAAVERDTGLSKDTLRVWERRYGFPVPARDEQGDRLYDLPQVERLRLIKRLMDQGFRPGKIVPAAHQELVALIERQGSGSRPEQTPAAVWPPLVEAARLNRADDLRGGLQQLLFRMGLQRFVVDVIAPLNIAIGEAWLRGEIDVPAEHLYTEQVQNVLRGAIQAQPFGRQRPRVLLTTLPEEPHGLGLLMVEALLASEGSECVALGTRTPLTDIRDTATATGVDVVALSFSAGFPTRQAVADLAALRRALPESIGIWAGGAGVRGKARDIAGVRVIGDIGEVSTVLAQWRAERRLGLS
jgi:methylmalonyl-CoA mutase cobalamin-binding subunit